MRVLYAGEQRERSICRLIRTFALCDSAVATGSRQFFGDS